MDLFNAVKSDPDSLTSCLLPETVHHFRLREQQLAQLDIELEKKREQALHAVEQRARGLDVLAVSPKRADTTSSSSSARAHSASSALNQREGCCKTSDDNRHRQGGGNSDTRETGVRRARTAGVERCPLYSGDGESPRECPQAAAPLAASDVDATAGERGKPIKEHVHLREAIFKDPYVACEDVGSGVREEYSAVFLPSREAAEANSCTTNGSCRERDALVAALEAQRHRVLVLQQELSARFKETQSLAKELFECKSQKITLEGENENLKKKVDQLVLQAERAKSSHAESCGKVEVLEKAVTELKAENNRLSSSSQKSVSELKKKEAQLQRLTEEAAALRELLKASKNKTNDTASSLHKECEKLGAENKRLLSQRNELIQGFKKQMKLIDVLKKQKAHMEAARLLSFSEEEFLKILRID